MLGERPDPTGAPSSSPDDLAQRYDEIAYPGQPYLQTHPDRLATVATLLGMRPPPVEGCRVLEIGCGDGANLIPIAAALPGSAFLGIDLAAGAVAEGQATAAALGLTNIELRQLDLMDLPDDAGPFDYIIAHGVYSWVPPAVQERLLAAGGRLLSPQGVAYVSYNALPGWHMMGIVRDLLRYGTRAIAAPRARAAAALELLDQLADTPPAADDAFASLLAYYAGLAKESLAESGSRAIALMHHDMLAPINEPLSIADFAARAARHGLQYLAETHFPAIASETVPGPLAAALRPRAADVVELEQLMDFARGRQFRQTLLCRAQVVLDRQPRPERLLDLALGSPAEPLAAQPDITGPGIEQFRGPDGASIGIADPLAKAALLHMIERCPEVIPFGELLRAARARIGAGAAEADAARLAAVMLDAHRASARLVSLHAYRPRLTAFPGERPLASPVARHQARAGATVTNLYHRGVELDAFRRCLLLLLDGRRDRAGLLETLVDLVARGTLVLQQEGRRLEDADAARRMLAGTLEGNLRALASMALLVE